MNSPWGPIQCVEGIVVPGISWVSTASHGGLRISTQIAQQRLSKAAQRRAIVQDGYYWYEEDCLYAIAAYELDDCWPILFHGSSSSPETLRADLLQTISTFNADYLIERDIEPEPTAYTYWLLNKLADTLRSIRDVSPNTVQKLVPEHLGVTVEVSGGCCTAVQPDPASTMFLRRLGIDFSYQVQDLDNLEENIS